MNVIRYNDAAIRLMQPLAASRTDDSTNLAARGRADSKPGHAGN
jgi:hypothetical protein